MTTYPFRQQLAPSGYLIGVQYGHEHLRGVGFAGGAVGHVDGLAGVADEQPFAGRVGFAASTCQLLAQATLGLAERAVRVFIRDCAPPRQERYVTR